MMSRFFHVLVKVPTDLVLLSGPLDRMQALSSSHDDAYGRVDGGSYVNPASQPIARSDFAILP